MLLFKKGTSALLQNILIKGVKEKFAEIGLGRQLQEGETAASMPLQLTRMNAVGTGTFAQTVGIELAHSLPALA